MCTNGMFSEICCGQIELSVATLWKCSTVRMRMEFAAFSHPTTDSWNRVVFSSHSIALIRPSIYRRNTYTHDTYKRTNKTECIFFPFYVVFVFVVRSAVQRVTSMIIWRNDESTYGQIKKCLQSVVVVVPNGSYISRARQSKSYSSPFTWEKRICVRVVGSVRYVFSRRFRGKTISKHYVAFEPLPIEGNVNCLSLVIWLKSMIKQNAFVATNLWTQHFLIISLW